ncbi:MAG: hypothetical protein J7L61_00290 [Thermoplasmata archaeon]|nr:hypothetical protein [Thermoplasmata archaeon]
MDGNTGEKTPRPMDTLPGSPLPSPGQDPWTPGTHTPADIPGTHTPTADIPETQTSPPAPEMCPSCGKYTGGKHQCPHCGADTVHRIKETVLVAFALSLLLIGGALYMVAGTAQEPPAREIGSLGMEDIYEHVRVIGTVVSEPTFYPDKYDPTSGVIKVRVNDTTGELNVKLEKPVTKEVITSGMIPCVGDVIDVRGTLYVGDGWMQITCITPDFLKIKERNIPLWRYPR